MQQRSGGIAVLILGGKQPARCRGANSDLKKIMASLFEKFENTIIQRMSTVATYFKDSRRQKRIYRDTKKLYLIKLTDLQNFSRTKDRGGGGGCKKLMSLKTN